jgi:hypothetical protein
VFTRWASSVANRGFDFLSAPAERRPSGEAGIALEQLTTAWLPGLTRDRHLVGANWSANLTGLELEPNGPLLELIEFRSGG